MDKEISVKIDPLLDSDKYLLILVFAKTSSPSYSLAVSIAKGASVYNETVIDNKIIHISAYDKTRDGASKALAILNYISGIKSLQIFFKGHLAKHSYAIMEILQCYITSCSCIDPDAHCKCVIDNPFQENYSSMSFGFSISLSSDNNESKKPIEVQRYLFPCKYLFRYFQFQLGHPSTIENQIQASGVNNNCDWCPNFKPESFIKLPKKILFPDGKVIIDDN